MDVQEIRKLESYMRRLFGNAKLRVVPRPKKDDCAEVCVGEESIGELFVDDDDEERSYNFQMPILPKNLDSSPNIQGTKKVEAYLKRLLSNTLIRVVPRPKKDDSAEVYVGEEFIGVLFIDDKERSYQFNLAILAIDLE